MLAFGDQVTFASPDSGLLEAEGLLDARLWVRTGGEPGDGQSCLFEVVPLRPGEGEVAGQPVLYGYLIQLRHVRSGLFVALRERVLAHLEPDCLRVELGTSDSSCWLSVQPGSSASRAEGECVREGDRVLLLSAKTRQQLHCSAHALPDLECSTCQATRYVAPDDEEAGVDAVDSGALAHGRPFAPFAEE